MKKILGVIGVILIFSFTSCIIKLPETSNSSGGGEVPPVQKVVVSGGYATSVSANRVNFKISVTPLDANGNLISGGVTKDNFYFKDVTVTSVDYSGNEAYYTSATVTVTGIGEVKNFSTTGRMIVALLIDSSGSMSDNDPDNKRVDAAKSFINNIGPNDLVAIYDFGSCEADVRLLQDFTSDKNKLNDALENIEACDGTPMYEAMVSAATHMKHFKLTQGKKDDHYVMILLTDGEANSKDLYHQAITEITSIPAPVFTVGLGEGVNVTDLTNIAQATGGSYLQANQADQLIQILSNQSVAASKGYVVVNGRGEMLDALEWGVYKIRGKLITRLGGNTVPTIFEFTFSYNQ